MRWSVFPALRIAILFMVGVIVGNVVDVPLYILLFVVFAGLCTVFVSDRKKGLSEQMTLLLSIGILIISFVIGITRVQLQEKDNDAYHYHQFISDSTDVAVVKVVEDIKYKSSVKTTVNVQYLNGQPCRGKMLVYFPKEDTLEHIKPGNVLTIKTKIVATRVNSNPASFDYKAYLKNRGIEYQAYLRKGMYHKVTDGKLPFIFQLTYDLRERALNILEERLHTKNQLATASAMILGYRDHISEELYNAYATTGSVHVLAVSGLHVGIICWVFIVLFKRIKSEEPRVKVFKMLTLLGVVWFYAILTGAAPAVIRSAVMFSIMIVGKYWFDNQNIYNSLAISAVVLLMFDPYLLFQASFQFSYLALLGILYFHRLLYPLLESRYNIIDKIWNLAVVSVAAQTLVFPVTVYYFHKFPLYFIISGIVSVSIAFFILINGILVLCFSWLPILGDVFAWSLRLILDVFIGIIYILRDLPMSNISGLWLSSWTTVIIYVGLVIVMLLVKWSSDFRLWLALSVVGVGLVIQNVRFQLRTLEQSAFVVYDTGQESLFDIIEGRKCQTFQSDGLTAKKIAFAAYNYRIGKNIHTTTLLQRNDFKNGMIQFKNTLIYVPSMNDSMEIIPAKTDILLLNNHCSTWASHFDQLDSIGTIVMDKSIDWRKRKSWIALARDRNIPMHDIREDGAFVLR